SGTATGTAPDLKDLNRVKEALPGTPLLVGSGATIENASALLNTADGIIVASNLKRQGLLENPIDVQRVRSLGQKVRGVRKSEDLQARRCGPGTGRRKPRLTRLEFHRGLAG